MRSFQYYHHDAAGCCTLLRSRRWTSGVADFGEYQRRNFFFFLCIFTSVIYVCDKFYTRALSLSLVRIFCKKEKVESVGGTERTVFFSGVISRTRSPGNSKKHIYLQGGKISCANFRPAVIYIQYKHLSPDSSIIIHSIPCLIAHVFWPSRCWNFPYNSHGCYVWSWEE